MPLLLSLFWWLRVATQNRLYRAMVQTLMDKKMHEVLLNNDQLKSSMAEGLVLQHFTGVSAGLCVNHRVRLIMVYLDSHEHTCESVCYILCCFNKWEK